jgi:NADH-quinone oxidoreductase subunit L
MEHTNDALRWIVLLPLIGAVVSGGWLLFIRRELPRFMVVALTCGAPLLAFFIALVQVFHLTGLQSEGRYFVDNVYTWIGVHPFYAELSFLLDPLSAVMVLIVTGVGSAIHIYSVGYMGEDHRADAGFQRFFCYLNLFLFSMLMLVLGDNLLVLFVGWEGVGLCSYLLIGFWFLDDPNAYCGQKAFIVNRIGDFGFLLGIFLLFWTFFDAGYPTIEFRAMSAQIGEIANRTVEIPGLLGFLPGFPSWKLLTLAGILFFIGACGKSAQIPLYVWLPDAMAGPTPVSALIHAATMVTAGVYMVCRLSFLYSLAPGALATVAWVGGITALFAATIAVLQKDIKKVLAYSTVSQLGYMFLAAGVASYTAAVFHLMTHAFFKALLFLGAGSVILGMHHEQDTDRMGGLRRLMPWTHGTFLIGTLAIAGFPGLSGFFSKDEILVGTYAAHAVPGHAWLYWIGIGTAVLTAFYMFRLYFRTFAGESRAPVAIRAHIREQSAWILVPLVILAILSAVGGFLFGLPDIYGEMIGIDRSNSLHYFLEPLVGGAEHEISHSTELMLTGFAVLAAGTGIVVAAYLYVYRTDLPGRLASTFKSVYRVVFNKYYVDELYDAIILRPLVWVSDRVLYRIVDARIIDGAGVNGTARAIWGVADRGLKYVQTGFIQSYVLVMLVGGVALIAYLLRGL